MSVAVAARKFQLLKVVPLRVTSCGHLFVKNSQKDYWQFMTTKCMQDPNYIRPAPFDYENENKIGWNRYFPHIDNTAHRFDENSKIIVVDGPFGVGKRELAKQLAADFDLHYEPDATIDLGAIDHGLGVDMRDYEAILPQRFKFMDLEKFLKNPFDERSSRMQCMWFQYRILTYLRALRHIFNSGQGVVLNRSALGAHAMVTGMVEAGFLSKEFLKFFMDLRKLQIGSLLRPHIFIYLDAPYEVCQQRIKERNLPYHADSKFHTRKLHESIDNFYKNEYIPLVTRHAEVLIYDWTEKQDSDDIAMDIEKIPFLGTDNRLCRQTDWVMKGEVFFKENRFKYTYCPSRIIRHFSHFIPHNVPELTYTPDEVREVNAALENLIEFQHRKGFNPGLGDNYLWKTAPRHHDMLDYNKPLKGYKYSEET